MIKRLLAVLISTAALGFLASAAWADNGAQKVPFFNDPSYSCVTGATGGEATDSFAVIKMDGNNTVSAEVSLKQANPNDNYLLVLIGTPTCSFLAEGQLTTNGQGNGNVHLSGPSDGSSDANVEAFAFFPYTGPYVFLATPDVVFGG